ncbi:hypothetical protein V3G39_14310 [Dermatophilaceae bacterium Sec6.4]
MNEPIAPLFRLTDEELDLLSAAAEVDTPYLDRLDANGREVAVNVAYRSLCAHGVCEAQGGGLLVPDELVQLLQVRSGCERRYRVELHIDGSRSVRHVYEAGGTAVCEDISSDGLHDFDVVPASRTALLVAAALAPVFSPASHGETVPTGCRFAGDLRLLAEPAPWGVVLATADVTQVVTGSEDEFVCVIWGDAGTYLVSSPSPRARSGFVVGHTSLAGLVAEQLGIDRAS